MESVKLGAKVSWFTIIINFILFIVKFIGGIVGNSKALIADAVHTLSDIFTTALVIVGLKIANKEADECHQYGHEKFESLIVKIMSALLIFSGVIIAYKSVMGLINPTLDTPSKLTLIIAAISIITKELMFFITIKYARLINSPAMATDAYHHHSDALSSIGVFLGIFGARLGLWYLDSIGGIVVSLIIIKLGLEYYLKAIKDLVDYRASDEIVTKISQITNSIDGVYSIAHLKTRVFGNKVYSDLHINIQGDLTILEGSQIAQNVHDEIEKQISEIKHCSVIIVPTELLQK